MIPYSTPNKQRQQHFLRSCNPKSISSFLPPQTRNQRTTTSPATSSNPPPSSQSSQTPYNVVSRSAALRRLRLAVWQMFLRSGLERVGTRERRTNQGEFLLLEEPELRWIGKDLRDRSVFRLWKTRARRRTAASRRTKVQERALEASKRAAGTRPVNLRRKVLLGRRASEGFADSGSGSSGACEGASAPS